MLRTDLLKERIVSQGLTQAEVANRLGMTARTFYTRMKRGVFRSDEVEAMAELLGVGDPSELCVFYIDASGKRNGGCV